MKNIILYGAPAAGKGTQCEMLVKKYGYINEKCEYVIAPKYEDATAFGTNGLAAVCIGGKYGYINIKEEIVIEPQFDDADEFDEMGFAGIKIGDKWGFINEKAEKIVEPRFDKVFPFEFRVARRE